jgi:sugar phosphate isomerase/epimerase
VDERYWEMTIMTRRASLLIALLLVSWATTATIMADEKAGEQSPTKSPRWQLSLMAYTYRKLTLFEAVDHAKALGLKHIETYGWQAISPELKAVQFNPEAPVSALAKVKNKLDDAGIRMSGFYARELGKKEDATRKVFDFAKLMDIPTIICEPPAEAQAFEMIDQLANEYRINVAIHNHPAPSTYSDPKTALKLIKNCSPRIGVCADTGHWVRSRLNPAECLKQYAGRIIQLHLKDIVEAKKEARDVPWGTGIGDIKAQLAELDRQGFNGIFSIEYESNPDNPTADVQKCIEQFKDVAGKLGR